ncbi:MAG: exonuclease subunit SbcD, partial [Candidatus Eremiobacterota bacterium]
MRVIHTADWHLGRVLCGVSLLDEQAHVLEQVVSAVSDFRANALLISGDLYDRVVPPPEAVTLFDEILSVLVKEVKVKVIFIDGFQDSPDRLAFAARLLENQGVYARTTLQGSVFVELHDESGPVRVYPIPCADMRTLRQFLGRPDLAHPAEASLALIEKVKRAHKKGIRSVVL